MKWWEYSTGPGTQYAVQDTWLFPDFSNEQGILPDKLWGLFQHCRSVIHENLPPAVHAYSELKSGIFIEGDMLESSQTSGPPQRLALGGLLSTSVFILWFDPYNSLRQSKAGIIIPVSSKEAYQWLTHGHRGWRGVGKACGQESSQISHVCCSSLLLQSGLPL